MEPRSSRLRRVGPRAVGVLLVVWVVWMVGWEDRVTGVDGTLHTGRVVETRAHHVLLRADGEDREIPVEGPDAVRRGLAGAFGQLVRNPVPGLLAALALLASMSLIQVRWSVFLRAARLPTPWREVFRLGWIGMFFNQVLPAGQVGGDVVKAFYIARAHPGRRTMAVVSVLADRGIGLFSIVLVAFVAVWFAPAGSRIGLARGVVVGLFAFCLAFLALVFSARARRVLQLRRLPGRLPFAGTWMAVGEAFAGYGARPGMVALSVVAGLGVHATLLLFFFLLASAMHAHLPAFALLVAIPVALMAGSIPGLPAGWGVGDAAFYFFLPAAGVDGGTAVALSFVMRALIMLISLPGGLLLRGARPTSPG